MKIQFTLTPFLLTPFLFVLLVIFSCSLSLKLAAAGNEQNSTSAHGSEKFLLDGKAFTKEQLIQDFLQVSFREDVKNITSHKQKLSSYAVSRMPWIEDLQSPDVNMAGLHKFPARGVTIGFGWPPLQSTRADYERYNDKYNVVQSQILKMKPYLEKAIGQNITIIGRDEETLENYAKIRVVFFEGFFTDNRFKADPRTSASPLNDETMARHMTKSLPHIDFTPLSRTSVTGYLIPDDTGNIAFSVCEIWPYFQKNLEAALVTECVLRSLGLPNQSANPSALLGDWNSAHAEHSKLRALDGNETNIPWTTQLINLQKKFLSEMPDNQYLDEYPPYTEAVEKLLRYFPHGEIIIDEQLSSPTDYDLAILSLLYCNDLQAGDVKDTVISKLASTHNCLNDNFYKTDNKEVIE